MNKKIHIFCLLLSLVISTTLFAQSKFINYQGVASDASGAVLANQSLSIKIALIFGNATNVSSYEENQNVTTDANGVFSLAIGNGTTIKGVYNNLVWGDQPAHIQVFLNGTSIGTTELKAVPFALNSSKATGLEKITEGTNTGWRLIGVDPGYYANIGSNAVDLSYNDLLNEIYGASGEISTAMGRSTISSGLISTAMGSITTASGLISTAMGSGTTASGSYSTALGVATRASGSVSTALGRSTKAESYASLAIGRYNIGGFTIVSGNNNDGDEVWIDEDPLFEIGNGINLFDAGNHNALTVLKNGKVGIGYHKPESVFEVTHQNGFPTATNLTNAFSIRNEKNGESWQFNVDELGALGLYRNGSGRGYFSGSSGAYIQTSDRRVKNEITPLENGTLNKVMQLNPVSYLMKDQKDTKRNLGLISQEVQKIFPSIIHYIEEKDLLTLSYTELIPILIKALQEQQAIIEGQHTNIDKLSAEVSEIKSMLKDVLIKNTKTMGSN